MKLYVYQPWFINAYVELRVSSVFVWFDAQASVSHLSCLSMSPQSRLLRRAASTPGGPTASRGSGVLHPRWTGEESRPVCDWRTPPPRSNVRSCEPRSTPSLPLTDSRVTAHARSTHACALLLRVSCLVSLANPIPMNACELKWTGSWRWSWGLYSSIIHNLVKCHKQCKADVIKMRYTIQD